jgi:small-conductance mechanosensitive channel
VSRRPLFDPTRLTAADRTLAAGSAALLADSLLPWQRQCEQVPGAGAGCAYANAWGGSGSWAGIVMGLLVVATLAVALLALLDLDLPSSVRTPAAAAGLAFGAAFFTLLKFLLVVARSPSYGAWIGLLLSLAMAYGAWMKTQEERVLPPPEGGFGG